MRIGIGFFLSFILMFMAGCGKITEAQKSQLATVALVAKERASAFTVLKSQIQPKNEADRQVLARLMDRHSNGLKAGAIALADFVTATQSGRIDKRTRETLVELGKTMTVDAIAFDISLKTDIKADGELLAFLTDHNEVLKSTAASLMALSGELKTKELRK